MKIKITPNVEKDYKKILIRKRFEFRMQYRVLDIMKLKKINFTVIKKNNFLKDVDIEKVLISNKISAGAKKLKIRCWLLV